MPIGPICQKAPKPFNKTFGRLWQPIAAYTDIHIAPKHCATMYNYKAQMSDTLCATNNYAYLRSRLVWNCGFNKYDFERKKKKKMLKAPLFCPTNVQLLPFFVIKKNEKSL
jgi:hypothetical protein